MYVFTFVVRSQSQSRSLISVLPTVLVLSASAGPSLPSIYLSLISNSNWPPHTPNPQTQILIN